jgi:hypothetical protein
MKPLSERYSTIIGMVAFGQPGNTDRDVWHEVAALESRIEALEKENRALRANVSKSVLRRLEGQGALRREEEKP